MAGFVFDEPNSMGLESVPAGTRRDVCRLLLTSPLLALRASVKGVHPFVGGSGGEDEFFPECVPVVVEVVGSEGGDGGGTVGGPVHAGSFEADRDQLFRGRFDHAAADLPVGSAIGRIVGAIESWLDVVDQCDDGLPLLAAL